MLYLKCKGQVMSVDVDERIADQYINANTVHFEFCERWNGMTITAQFTQTHKNEETGVEESKTYNKLIDEVTNTVILPNEIVAGKVEISAFGVHPTTGVRITSVPVKKTVDKSGFVGDGEQSIPPTPDLYAQLLEKVNKTAIPHIGANGNWWFDDFDSGVSATAEIETAKKEAINEIDRQAANALATLPEDYVTLSGDVNQLKDTKADAIRDISAKAVAHELHAQDGPMSVTLHGKTVETGSGDKSPENPYTISGVDEAQIRAGSKNLFGGKLLADKFVEVVGATLDESAKTVTYSAGDVNSGPVIYKGPFKPGVQYTIIVYGQNSRTDKPRVNLGVSYDDGTHAQIVNFETPDAVSYSVFVTTAGKNVKSIFGYNSAGNTTLYYDRCGIFEGALTADDFVPFNANVIDMPLLPDGDPLMEGDTVENDVLSGCDIARIYDGSDSSLFQFVSSSTDGGRFFLNDTTDSPYGNLAIFSSYLKFGNTYPGIIQSSNPKISIFYPGVSNIAELCKELQKNPLKVYYRSTAYTPEQDLRVCRVMRRSKAVTLDGSIIPDTLTVLGNCVRCSIKTGISNSDAAIGVCGEVPYRFDYSSDTEHVYISTNSYAYVFVQTDRLSTADKPGVMEYLQGNPITVYIMQATPEIYYTDHHELRKPYGLMPVTVTGLGETAVKYPHDTKHYIDSQIAAAVSLALGN